MILEEREGNDFKEKYSLSRREIRLSNQIFQFERNILRCKGKCIGHSNKVLDSRISINLMNLLGSLEIVTKSRLNHIQPFSLRAFV